MKFRALLIILVISLSIGWQRHGKSNLASDVFRGWLLSELRHSQSEISLSLQKNNNINKLRLLYHKARRHYKHIEFFVEYCSPREAKYFINGPLVPKPDVDWGKVFYPQGFQRIEEILFHESQDTLGLHQEYNLLLAQLEELNQYYQSIEITDGALLEMCQVELFRIASLNLNGYDATISQTNIQEAIWCLEGLESAINAYKPYQDQNTALKRIFLSLKHQLSSAKSYLQKNKDYNSFNRLQFITSYINPLNRLLVEFHDYCKLPWSDRKQALNLKQAFLFGKESFNVRYFAMYYDDTVNLEQQAELGKLLFFDPALSGNNQRSCATCHNPSIAFTDGKLHSVQGSKETIPSRNAPTLLNVIYQKAFFLDGRAYQLEQQIFDVVHNQNEMQSSLDDIVVRLRQSSEYKKFFRQAFRGTADTSITPYAIQKSLTEYEKTLISFDSPFDQYLHGDLKRLNTGEINGYNLFAGKALCGSCHFFPLFNGTAPPFFNDSEFEVIGTPENASNSKLDGDVGRFNVTQLNEQLYAFKTPTVRNISFTAPYMHNGVYTTLEEIVDFYHRGGGKGFGFSISNQTLPFDSLQLTPSEKHDIVLFMKKLSDTTGTTKRPARLPDFENNKGLNNRKVGGGY